MSKVIVDSQGATLFT